MGTISKELSAKIKSLPDNEKIELVDSIMMQLDHHEAQEGLERVSHGHMGTNRSEGEFTNALEIS